MGQICGRVVGRSTVTSVEQTGSNATSVEQTGSNATSVEQTGSTQCCCTDLSLSFDELGTNSGLSDHAQQRHEPVKRISKAALKPFVFQLTCSLCGS